MIKRPLNARFTDKAREDIKITTIREKPWPVGKPIMLYNWTGLAYRSPQIDVCAVEVLFTTPITITHLPSGQIVFDYSTCGDDRLLCLWESEGFADGYELEAWFRPLVKQGETVTKHLMRFTKLDKKP